MDRLRRFALEIGSRNSNLARRESRRWGERFLAHPTAFLNRLVSTWPASDQELFRARKSLSSSFCDLRQVFIDGNGPETFAQELRLYRNYGFSPADLPRDSYVTLWQGLDDIMSLPPWPGKWHKPSPAARPTLCRGDISSRSLSRITSSPA